MTKYNTFQIVLYLWHIFTIIETCGAFQWKSNEIIQPPPDQFGKYPTTWPKIDGMTMPILSPSTSSDGPSFLQGQPLSDPGGYVLRIYHPNSTYNAQEGPKFNQFAFKFTDFLGYSFIGVGYSQTTDEGYYNCTQYAPDVYMNSDFFSGHLAGATICTDCCQKYFGFAPWYTLPILGNFLVSIETAIVTGFCDVTNIYPELYCIWVTGYGWCSDNILTRNTRKIVIPCLINMYYYLISSCPVYTAIGLYPWFCIYEPPLYCNAGTVSDSIQVDALNFVNSYDNVCIPYSYYGYQTPIISCSVTFAINSFIVFILLRW